MTASQPTESLCYRCGYSLRTLPVSAVCPECGTPVADSLLTPQERKLRVYEDAILNREHSYRLNRSGALAFALIAVVTLIMMTSTSFVRKPENIEGLVLVVTASVPFWLAIACGQHARLRHIASIRAAREKFGIKSHRAGACAAEAAEDPSPRPLRQ